MPFSVGSLFAGVGGICKGFQNACTTREHFELAWANEIDEFACETYRTNYTHTLLQGDIEKIIHPTRVDDRIAELREQIKTEDDEHKSQLLEDELSSLLAQRDNEFEQYQVDGNYPAWIEEQDKVREFEYYLGLRNQIIAQPIDVLNGGFPCQAFSIAGEQYGFKDPRGNLFISIVDLIELLGVTHTIKDEKGNIIRNGKPRVLFLENVKNLQSHDNGRTYKHIKKCLEDCGYTIFEKVLNTMDYSDLPQNRERIYIVGFRDASDAAKFNFFSPEILAQHKVKKASMERVNDVKQIIDYKRTIVDSEKYYYTREKYPHYFVTAEEFEGSDKDIRINLDEQVDEMYQFYQCRRGQYVRKNKSDVCPTLTANMGTGGHNVPLVKVKDGVRKITPEEAFKLQGFPIGNGYTLPTEYNGRAYSDSHLYKQAGNAVSVPMIQMLAQAILEIIE